MYEVVTSYAPLIVAFIVGTLVPRIYESVLNVFFHMPDQFLHYVNTTLVPRFGDNGGKIVLVVSQTAVMIIKQIGSMLVTVAKHLLPLVLRVIDTVTDIMIYSDIGEYVAYLASYLVPVVKAAANLLSLVWGELASFFSWTTSAVKTEFFRFGFHLALLYLSVHLLIWGIKRMLKKVV